MIKRNAKYLDFEFTMRLFPEKIIFDVDYCFDAEETEYRKRMLKQAAQVVSRKFKLDKPKILGWDIHIDISHRQYKLLKLRDFTKIIHSDRGLQFL